MLKAIAIEDEQAARDVLRFSIDKYCGNKVELVAEASTLLKGVDLIRELEPDLVFLDIEMPNHSGLELLEYFDEIHFEIIFITAYSEHALKAFELAAIDYLLKPLQADRLTEAIEKVIVKKEINKNSERIKILENYLQSNQVHKVTIPYAGGYHIIQVEDIVMIQAERAYCTIYLKDSEILVSKSLNKVEEMIQELPYIFRSHRSYIVNLQQINHFSKLHHTIDLTSGRVAKISQNRIKDLSNRLKEL